MNAQDAVNMKPEAFERALSETISPKPWKHEDDFCPRGICDKCGHEIPHVGTNVAFNCSVPPELTEPLEVLAKRYRKELTYDERVKYAQAAMDLFPRHIETALSEWMQFDMPVEMDLACSMVALGLWEI
jgi:hypothetical protein